MKKIVYLLVCWLVVSGLGIETVRAQAGIRAAGGLATGTGGRASYSVGQLATAVARGPGGTLNPGVQQPLLVKVLSTASQASIQLESSVYPNPAPALLHLRVASPVPAGLAWCLTDLNGRQLLRQPLTEPITAVSLADFAAGAYLLIVSGDARALKTFKIIKP